MWRLFFLALTFEGMYCAATFQNKDGSPPEKDATIHDVADKILKGLLKRQYLQQEIEEAEEKENGLGLEKIHAENRALEAKKMMASKLWKVLKARHNMVENEISHSDSDKSERRKRDSKLWINSQSINPKGGNMQRSYQSHLTEQNFQPRRSQHILLQPENDPRPWDIQRVLKLAHKHEAELTKYK